MEIREFNGPVNSDSERERLRMDRSDTLEAVKRRETELRKKLLERLYDDEEYFAANKRAKEFIDQAGVDFAEPIERGRALIAARNAVEDMFKTERGRITAELEEVQSKRELAEEEVAKLKEQLEPAEK